MEQEKLDQCLKQNLISYIQGFIINNGHEVRLCDYHYGMLDFQASNTTLLWNEKGDFCEIMFEDEEPTLISDLEIEDLLSICQDIHNQNGELL